MDKLMILYFQMEDVLNVRPKYVLDLYLKKIKFRRLLTYFDPKIGKIAKVYHGNWDLRQVLHGHQDL